MITVTRPPSIILNVGASLTLVSSCKETDVKYQWLYNGKELQGQTSPMLSRKMISTLYSGKYTLKYTQGNLVKYSDPVNVWVVISSTPPVVLPPTSSFPPTSSLPPTSSIQIGGSINGLSQSFVAGTSYNLQYVPIGFGLDDAHIIWESNISDVAMGNTYTIMPQAGGIYWIQAEACLVDGRRVITDGNISVNESVSNYIELYNPNINTDTTVKNWFSLDDGFQDSKSVGVLSTVGNVSIDSSSFIFPNRNPGGCATINGITDYMSYFLTPLSASVSSLSVECMMRLKTFNQNGAGNASIIRIEKSWNTYFAFLQDMWTGPAIQIYNNTLMTPTQVIAGFPINQWNHIKLLINKSGYYVFINGIQTGLSNAANAIDTFLNSNVTLTIGQEIGYVDEIIIKYS